MKLYEIESRLREALDTIDVDMETGEITNADTLHDVEMQACDKLEGTGLYIREIKADIDALKQEADRLTQRRRSLEKKVSWLQGMMVPGLEALGGKVKTPRLTIYTRHTFAVQIDDMALVPEAFKQTKTEIVADKRAIKDALEAGQVVTGARMQENLSVNIR